MNQIVRWDYEVSVKKMRPLVIRWKTVTEEMLDELYKAKEVLAPRRPGKIDVSNDTSNTWSGYLEAIGLPRKTAHRWLEFWNPIDKKRIEPPSQPKREPEPEKPRGRTINDEEYERRKEEAIEEETSKSRPLDEIFEDVQKVVKRQENEEVFREFDLDALIEELRRRIVSIADPSRRHHAINQIIKAMRELAIECDKLSVGR